MPAFAKQFTFESDADLTDWLSANQLSKNSGVKKCASRIKQYYKCSHGKRDQCPFVAYVVTYPDRPDKDVYIRGEHEHKNNAYIPNEAKKILENCDKSKIAPKQARVLLEKEGFGQINPKQHYNLLCYMRSKSGTAPSGPSYTNLDFNRFCDLHPPHGRVVDQHDLLVPIYNSSPDRLYCFMTTRHMLEMACQRNFIQIDATYKVIWQDYPVIVMGTSDLDRRFHPIGLSHIWSDESSDAISTILAAAKSAVSTVLNRDINVQSVMADGSAAITKSISEIFPFAQRLMCWSHVERACQRHRSLLVDTWPPVKKDLSLLQLAPSPGIFYSAAAALTSKLHFYALDQFGTYLDSSWVRGLPFWFEGAARTFPSTNNGLESFNNLLKVECTKRERLSLPRFLDCAKETLERWSRESAEKGFTMQPTHSRQTLIDGWAYYSQNPIITCLNGMFRLHANHIMYAVKSSNSDMPFDLFMDHFSRPHFSTFDEYKSFIGSWYVVDNIHGPWYCTCHDGFKHQSCKHIIADMIMFHGFTVPINCQTLSLKGKRKKVRPAKVSNALSYN